MKSSDIIAALNKETDFVNAQKRLDELFSQRENLVKLMSIKGMVDQQTLLSIKSIDDEVRALQAFVTTYLLSSQRAILLESNRQLKALQSETRILKWFTFVLILLTLVLTVLTGIAVYK
jgi:translation elongation factor EF-Ts